MIGACDACKFDEAINNFSSLTNKITEEKFLYRYNDSIFKTCEAFLKIYKQIQVNTGDDLNTTLKTGKIPWNYYKQVSIHYTPRQHNKKLQPITVVVMDKDGRIN